jgi:hypothetical protein
MSSDEYNEMQRSPLRYSMLSLLVLGCLGAGIGCAGTSYKDTHTHIEASGERNAAALRLVRSPADMQHSYVCRKGEDGLVCRKACGTDQIRCPETEVTVNGAQYLDIGRPETIPNNVSPEARQPSESPGAERSESSMDEEPSSSESMETESDSGAAESDKMDSGESGDMTGQDDENGSEDDSMGQDEENGSEDDSMGQDDEQQEGGDR